jgi:hypothetical protein
VVLEIRGPGIERRRLWVVTLASPPKELAGVIGLYGPKFEHLAGPARPAMGTVTDRATGKPLSGIHVVGTVPKMVYARGLEIDAVTDEQGNYRLEGLPKSSEYFISVDTAAGLVYLPQGKAVADTDGLKPLHAYFALDRGSVVEGRMIDRQTGKPIQGEVVYHPLPGNEQFKGVVTDWAGMQMRRRRPVAEDGSFKLLVFPGPGVVCATGDIDTYLLADVTKADAELGIGDHVNFSYEEMHAAVHINGHAYHAIRPGEKPESLKFDLLLDRGMTLSGSIAAGGKSVMGVRPGEFRRKGAYDLPITVTMDEKAGTFTATGLDPRRPNLLVFYQEKDQLAGSAQTHGDDKGPVKVQLAAWATGSGRVLGPDGKPAVGAVVRVYCQGFRGKEFRSGPLAKIVTTERDGTFKVTGLIPGLPFIVNVNVASNNILERSHDFEFSSVNEGEAKNLGDLKIPAPDKE